MEKLKRLGDAELEIMLAVWGAGEPVQSTYIHEKLKGSRDWAVAEAGVQMFRYRQSSLSSLGRPR